MFSIPAGSVFSKGCIRLGGELGTEACFVITGNPGRLARTWAGGKGAIGCPARQPAFDRRVTDLEGAHHLGTRHAGIKRVKHAFSEIERVCFHWCVLYHKLIFSAHYYSVIDSAAQLLRSNKLSSEKTTYWLVAISQHARKIEALLADFLEAMQDEVGLDKLQQEQIDFGALVRDIIDEQAGVTQTHQLRVSVDDRCWVHGDRRKLERMVANLVSNAVKYSPTCTDVLVTVRQSEGMIRLSVQDRGVGMAPDEVQQIFRPFVRLERTRDGVPGTGLGLVSVKKIVEAHRGRIGVRSQLHMGTLVEVDLPSTSAV